MRILNVAQTYFPYMGEGGRPAKVLAISRRLAQRGHKVTVLTADFGPGGSRTAEAAGIESSPSSLSARHKGADAIYLRSIARYRTVTLNPGVFGFCRKFLRDFDCVHIYGLYDVLGPTIASFCRRAGIPYLVEPMGMFQPIVRNIRLKRLYHQLLGHRLLAGASLLVATSSEEAKELVAGGVPESKIVIRRNGIETPAELPATGTFRREWQIPAQAKIILFLGRLVPKKSPDLLLQAFARSRLWQGPNHGPLVVLAGPEENGGYRKQLERLAAELGLQEQVLFTGPLYDERKWAAYRDADLFVLPSQNENFGNTVAEAVSCGTPVIVTDRCGIASLVNERAGLVLPYSVEALQAGLTKLLQDDTLRNRLRAGCVSLARELSWDEPIALMEKIYAQVLASGS